jgi:RNA polymerase sigma factor (sigma-70 family)
MKTFETNPPPDAEPTALDLLTEIALLKENGIDPDMKQAGKLFAELLVDYERYLRGLVQKQLPFSGATNRLDPDDLYTDLVAKIWENPHKFNPSGSTPEAIKRQFIGWASRILQNRVYEILASFKLQITEMESIEKLGWDSFQQEAPEPSERAQMIAEILNEMDPDDAEIIRWSVLSSPLDGSQMRTDPEERAELCRKLNVTPAGLRKRRERALKTLREEFEARISR